MTRETQRSPLRRGLAGVLLGAGVLFGVAACAGPAPFQARQSDHGPGYADQRLASNRYRVAYAGDSATPRETVENYLLLRAAR